jgi:hypothetical protein
MPIPFWCISLDTRRERWDAFTRQPGAGAVRRFPAVDGRSVDLRAPGLVSLPTRATIRRGTRRSPYEIATPGAIGCALSHAAVWYAAWTAGVPFVGVLEDDTVLGDTALADAAAWVEAHAGERWDVVNLWDNPANRTAKGRVLEWHGTNMYVLRTAALPRILPHVFPITVHLDHALGLASSMDTLYVRAGPSLGRPVITGCDTDFWNGWLVNLPHDHDWLNAGAPVLVPIVYVSFLLVGWAESLVRTGVTRLFQVGY